MNLMPSIWWYSSLPKVFHISSSPDLHYQKHCPSLIQSYQSDDKKRMNESKRNLITFTSRWDSFAFTAVDKWQCWLFRGLIKYQHSLTITKQGDMGKGSQYLKQLFLVFWKRCGVKKNRCKICTFQLKTDSRWKIRNNHYHSFYDSMKFICESNWWHNRIT